MRTEQELITPERARKLLEKNICNRPLRKKIVTKYAQIMQEGRWVVNGDTIRLNVQGYLVDGQHRLSAIVRSNLALETLVVYDLPVNAFATIDSGVNRTGGDALAVVGEKNSVRLGSILPLIDRYYMGKTDDYVRYDNDQILGLNNKYPDVKEILAVTHKTRKGFIPPSVLGACFYLFSKVDARLADDFVEKVVEGVNVVKGSSWYFLRERLERNMTSKSKLDSLYIMALCIKAWNFQRKNTAVKFLRWRDTGSAAEPFPTIL